jgi:hypothetical protein
MLMREAQLLAENSNPADSPFPITPDVEQMERFGEILVKRAGALKQCRRNERGTHPISV